MPDDINTMREKVNLALAHVEKHLLESHPELVRYFRGLVSIWEAQAGATLLNCVSLYKFSFKTESEMIKELETGLKQKTTKYLVMSVPDDEIPRC